MNKKIFTFLVALLVTMGWCAQAQVNAGDTPDTFEESKAYLLQTSDGTYLSVNSNEFPFLSVDGVDFLSLEYRKLQKFLWTISTTTVGGNAAYTFTNVSNGMILSLDSKDAVPFADIPYSDCSDILLGGDLVSWNGSRGMVTPGEDFFYIYSNNKENPDEIIALTYCWVGGFCCVVPALFEDKTAAEGNALKITPKEVEGSLPLFANDLNTVLGTKGIYESGKIKATEDSYFQLDIDPENTIDNPFAGELQAQAVYPDLELMDDYYAVSYNTFVALYAKDKGYVVVDTSFIAGTQQADNGLIQTTIDKKGLKDGAIDYGTRLPYSYMFSFFYFPATNTITVQSLEYIGKPTDVDSSDKVVWSWDAQTAIDNNTTVKYNDPAPNFSWLTYAQLGDEVAYTFGEQSEKMAIRMKSTTAMYEPTRVESGVYLLQIVGSTEAQKIGKFLKNSLAGRTEYVEVDPERQNLQHIPAAQWVLKSTTTNYADIKNREFVANEMGAESPLRADYYERLSGTTYATENDDEFFFLGGDTLKYIPVTAANQKDAKLGYLYVDQDGYNLDRFTLRYLHDLSMDNPVAVAANGKLFVNKEDQPTYFRLEEVGTSPYGYTGDLPGVAQLERTIYKIAAYETINFDGKKQYVTYDPDEKKYFLLDEDEFPEEGDLSPRFDYALRPSHFLLKENYEVTGEDTADCYYVLVEANMPIKAEWYDEDATHFMYENEDEELVGPAYNILLSGMDAEGFVVVAQEDGEWVKINDLAEGFLDHLYWSSYASSKVSVDNNNLALVNGILDDSSYEEVSVSAFKVGPDDTIIYRTIGAEEGEDALVQNIRIYRINATAKEYLYEDANSVYSVGPNAPAVDRKDIGDQINFLGVEGKGDDKLAEAVMTARYVRGTVMPQYLLMMDYHATDPTATTCPVCDELPEPIDGCPHHDAKDGFATARVLVNFADSVNGAQQKKENFIWNKYTRLGFVNAKFSPGEKTGVIDSTLTILSSKREAKYNSFPVKFTAEETKKEGAHQNVFFSMRLIDKESNDFLLESFAKDGVSGNTRIGGNRGGWVRIHNGVPVLCDDTPFHDAVNSEAEIFNFETTDDNATSNEGITAGKIKVEAGNGTVTIKGAAGQFVAIANILGQTVYTGTLDSDEATIAAPAGVVIVTVAGETAKALVK